MPVRELVPDVLATKPPMVEAVGKVVQLLGERLLAVAEVAQVLQQVVVLVLVVLLLVLLLLLEEVSVKPVRVERRLALHRHPWVVDPMDRFVATDPQLAELWQLQALDRPVPTMPSQPVPH